MASEAPDPPMSERSSSPADSITLQTQAPKRSADAAELKNSNRPAKSVKRRASKACQCCRSRKVRCNVVEHGAPCTNCRLDEVECIVSESKRKKKWSTNEAPDLPSQPRNVDALANGAPLPMSAHPPYAPLKKPVEHKPHALYQDLEREPQLPTTNAASSLYTPSMLMNLQRLGRRTSNVVETMPGLSSLLTPSPPPKILPPFIKPLPSRLSNDDIAYLDKKGALTIPAVPLRDQLLKCFAQFVHPYMPLLNLHDLVRMIDASDGTHAVSLLLFQAIMFSGVATVDIQYLEAAGYSSRRDARRDFFQKVRLLYDFDIELDRISIIQSLLLMTYWYETPDDQKDSHHWMGIAVSLSHTIGLHRNPDNSLQMDAPRRRLWKRIWWSTYMRDRLVALGMRRPTRIKDADFDVPMLELDDFESDVIPEGPSCIPADCTVLRDVEKQRQLAVMCIAKAKLCVCVSHVLSVQYSVLHNNHGVVSDEGTTRTTMMLVAKKLDPEVDVVQACDNELRDWQENLAHEARYKQPSWHDIESGNQDLALNRSLLHMVYYATLSALHRPQVLPSTAMPPREMQAEQLEISRKAVRLAATEITKIAYRLYHLDLVRFLPTPGITVLLPAIIIHLLDIKAPDEPTRRASLQGFCQCMQIMARLRDIYAAADYSTAFLEAAIRKAEITLPQRPNEVKEPRNVITSAQGLLEAGRRLAVLPDSGALTPPPERNQVEAEAESQISDDEVARRLNSYLASTPPDSDHQPGNDFAMLDDAIQIPMDMMEPDFDSMVNLDAEGDTWLLDDGAYAAMQGGESSGFAMDMDWMRGMKDGGLDVTSSRSVIDRQIAARSAYGLSETLKLRLAVEGSQIKVEANTAQQNIPPSSPPAPEHDPPVGSGASSSPRGRVRVATAQFASPDLVRLPPPRTPASTRSRFRDNSSEYYTAVWGSPYDRSLSPTASARTALSEQVLTEDQLGSSPPSFGLEHLITSRLTNFAFLAPEQPIGRSGVPSGYQDDEADPHTPRSRTKRWVQLPQPPRSENPHWWREESRSGSDGEGRIDRAAHLERQSGPAEARAKAHNSREQNRTLNQESFLELVRGKEPEEMSSLYASRWADTPPPEGHGQSPQAGGEQSAEDLSTQGHSGKAGAEAGWPVADGYNIAPGQAKPTDAHVSRGGVFSPAESAVADSADDAQAGELQPLTEATRLPAQRIRTRVNWRGKTCVVNIPDFDFESLGLARPMTSGEVAARIKSFEDEGYDTRGFALAADLSEDGLPAHGRPIYPDESELRSESRAARPKVLLPDLNRLKAEAERLIEEKLAALGVSLGGETTSPSPASAPLPGVNDLSRQSSGQYPSLPFSPPLPPGSGASMGRPPTVRGHSHTMSIASPMSPGNGPFGHMHRHSTFSRPMGFPQLQTQLSLSPNVPGQQTPMSGMQAFSPQKAFTLPGGARGGSPAQLAALRQDSGQLRGPGSPLSQQMFAPSPVDYSREMVQDQRHRQHGYSQSVQFMPGQFSMGGPNGYFPQPLSMQQTPTLPELPEEDDAEELAEPAPPAEAPPPVGSAPEPPAYVPPHKRAQFNADVAVPTPTRGHRHNISEGLERDILEAQQRHEAEKRDWIEVTERSDESEETRSGKPRPHDDNMHAEPASARGAFPKQPATHADKKPASRLNVTASSFTFNPTASFQPGASAFTFSAPAFTPTIPQTKGHQRQASSGTFNANAPAFKPSNMSTMPTSDFSFSSSGPTFKPDAPVFKPNRDQSPEKTVVDELPSIFGKLNIPSIVKPARRSKAVAIVRPDEAMDDSEEHEDDEGRVAQSEDRLKRQRFRGDHGDDVPQFAAMPDPADFAPTNGAPSKPQDSELHSSAELFQPAMVDKEDVSPVNTRETAMRRTHGHKPSSSLSALAKPFEPPSLRVAASDPEPHEDEPGDSLGDLEEGEIREYEEAESSRLPTQDSEPAISEAPPLQDHNAQERIGRVAHPEPSFDEIDAVMRQLNEADDSTTTGAQKDVQDSRALSPLPDFDDLDPMKGVSYLPSWSRSDAPSPSPRRKPVLEQGFVDPSFDTDSGERLMKGWARVTRLNKAEDVPASDWSGVLSPPDEARLEQRSAFFDSHIDDVVGRAVEQRLLPLEESLRSIQQTFTARERSPDRPRLQRTSSTVESDADDEDDLADEHQHRPISRGRDKRVDQIKAAVLEALREQSPRRSQSSYDIADLHSALADMKVSFARAASASIDLDDIRAIVEEVMQRQSQSLVPAASDVSHEGHRRELSELHGRLNETLAGALEEANQRRDMEERATETQRLLRLAEEELTLLRDSASDDDGRLAAMEEERRELIERVEKAEAYQLQTEGRVKEMEAENEALQATLEEYRTSSTKWRQEIDDGNREREELENAVSALERQLEEAQESGTAMKRRLEKLHGDMALAAGQLDGEKASWRAKEEGYRLRCDALEAQQASMRRQQENMAEELRLLRAGQAEGEEARVALGHLKNSHNSMEGLVRRLQADLAEKQSLAARFERDFLDAKETARAEVQRMRMGLQIDVENANHQVNIVRAQLEADLHRAHAELESLKADAELAQAKHERFVEEQQAEQAEAFRKINLSTSMALEEARSKHEATLKEITAQHQRVFQHAVEDKHRSEYILNEKLALSEAKLQHSQDRILHLEERLEVAKSAAQAAVMSAQNKGVSVSSRSAPAGPEKISPQALRESILVLQEQLQERESVIERLQNQIDKEGPAQLKEHDAEILWLRELLAVRGEDLTELVNTLAKPVFDRDAVRDTAIRIRANLEMQQQEKERFGYGPQSLGGQALASLSSFATPKATSLTSAFNKWRSTMESSALKSAPRSALPARSATPSRPAAPSSVPPGYLAGLMTPPASNLRTTPSPDVTSLSPPRLQSRPLSSRSSNKASSSRLDAMQRQVSEAPAISHEPVTPLFREQSYDRDAEDSNVELHNFDDDDLDVPDNEAPAFRSLEAELETSAADEFSPEQ